MIKKEKGITLIALIVTVIGVIILASISVIEGRKLIGTAEVESVMTNMITIKAKSKVVAEEVNAQVWALSNESEKASRRASLYTENYKMENKGTSVTSPISSQLDTDVTTGGYECYQLTEAAIEAMGLVDIEEITNYEVVYNKSDYTKLDIVYLPGIQHNNNTYYTLSKLQEDIDLEE